MEDNTAANREAATSISELVKVIACSGTMTASDQAQINCLAREPVAGREIMAIRHLTELIRDGLVKVV